MKRSTARWTTAMAAAALMALPATSWAQTTDPHRPATSATPSAQMHEQSPQEHLREARQAIRSIDKTELTGEARTRVEKLEQRLDRLEAAAAADPTTPGVETAERDVQWETEVAAIDRILNEMLGPAETTGAPGTPGAVGTTGTTGEVTLDPTSRNRLEEVRRHVKAFAEAKESKAADRPGTTTPADPVTGTTTPPTAAPPTTEPPTGDPQTMQPQTTQPQTGMPQKQEAARRHLTEARNTLSELTQLPAAAQLTGQQRTEVSQLISNFNELITTQADWRASYAKLEANLDALLGPERADAPPTARPTTEQPTTEPSTGAVGTAGTEETLNPEIRAKLQEFRRHLEKFEEAAGGPAPGATPGQTPYGQTPQAQPTPEQPTDPMAQQADRPDSQQARMSEEKRQQMLQHIEAIEAILDQQPGAAGTTGVPPTTGTPPTGTPPTDVPPTGVPPTGVPPTTTGTAGMTPSAITLDQNDVQQLRMHLSELRRQIEGGRQ